MSQKIKTSVEIDGSLTANSIVKSGGTASQILAADGSVVTAGSGVTISGGTISASGSAGVLSFNTRTGAVTLTSGDVTTALGYTPYNASNPAGYISSYTETDTLASVTARGATASVLSTFNDGVTIRRNLSTGQNIHTNILNNGGGYSSVVYIGSSPGADWLIGKDAYGVGNDKFQIGSWNGYSYIDITYNTTSGTINFPNNGGLTVNNNVILHAGNYSSYAVPTSRTITINGTSYDLSANRSWTVTASETDTLQTVTSRGNTTTTSITANSIIIPSFETATNVLSFRSGIPDGTNVGIRAKATVTANRDGLELLGYNGIDFSINNGNTVAGKFNNYGQFLVNAASSGYGSMSYGYNLGTRGNTSQSYISVALSNQTLDTQGLIIGIDTGYARFHVRDSKPISFANGDVERMTLDTSANLIANGSVRTPIFYDSNNTGYYVDPASTSNLALLSLYGHDNQLKINTYSGGAAGWFAQEAGVNKWETYHYQGRYRWYNYTTNQEEAFLDNAGGYLQVRTSMRAPIFYDSNDTAFYLDPASTSELNKVYYNSNMVSRNYGIGQIGVYDSTRYQAVFSMGEAYLLPANGTTTGNLYGLAWSHPNAGGVAGNLNTHGLLVMENGSFLAAVSGSIRARDDMRAPIFYDSNDTSYYLEANGTSRLYQVNAPQGYISNGNPWGTANSAYFPNGITTAGSDNWIYGHTYVGNAPANGAGHEFWSTGKEYHRSNEATNGHGASGRWLSIQSANGNFIPYSFESEYGNHSWGTVARFRINQAGADRPSIQFSNASNDTRWNIGYCYADDNFRIVQNMGYRNDNSNSDGWGTQRLLLDTAGNFYSDGLYQSNASLRSPIYYDSGNTGYYVDAASTTKLNALTLSSLASDDGMIENNTGGYFHLGGWGVGRTAATAVLVNTAYRSDYADNATNSDTVDGYHGDTFYRNLGFGSGYPSWNLNTVDPDRSGFTYSNAAPYTGPFIHIGASGYGLQFNAPYGGDGYGLAFRTRNGDNGTWNSWRYPAIYGVNANGGGELFATRYYDQNDTAYYCDPSDMTNLKFLQVGRPSNGQSGTKLLGGQGTSYGAITLDVEVSNYGTGIKINNQSSTYASSAMQFFWNGTQCGSVGIGPGFTSYNTSSDYRLKENISPMVSSIERVKELNPCRFNFINSPDRIVDGFIAHEVQAVIPEAITGEKDELNYDGTPKYQGIDQSKMVPLLTAALKEAIAKIEELENRLSILENK